jgi:hypothetical protein
LDLRHYRHGARSFDHPELWGDVVIRCLCPSATREVVKE